MTSRASPLLVEAAGRRLLPGVSLADRPFPEDEEIPTRVNVVMDFPEELKQRMRAAGK